MNRVEESREIMTPRKRQKRTYPKFFSRLLSCLKEGKHSHMLWYKTGTKKQFQVKMVNAHKPGWNLSDISLFVDLDFLYDRDHELPNYPELCKGRFKSNILSSKRYVKEERVCEKPEACVTIKTYNILELPPNAEVGNKRKNETLSSTFTEKKRRKLNCCSPRISNIRNNYNLSSHYSCLSQLNNLKFQLCLGDSQNLTIPSTTVNGDNMKMISNFQLPPGDSQNLTIPSTTVNGDNMKMISTFQLPPGDSQNLTIPSTTVNGDNMKSTLNLPPRDSQYCVIGSTTVNGDNMNSILILQLPLAVSKVLPNSSFVEHGVNMERMENFQLSPGDSQNLTIPSTTVNGDNMKSTLNFQLPSEVSQDLTIPSVSANGDNVKSIPNVTPEVSQDLTIPSVSEHGDNMEWIDNLRHELFQDCTIPCVTEHGNSMEMMENNTENGYNIDTSLRGSQDPFLSSTAMVDDCLSLWQVKSGNELQHKVSLNPDLTDEEWFTNFVKIIQEDSAYEES